MRNAQEYKGYYLDIFYTDGLVNGIIQQTEEELQGLTIEEVIREFKKKVNMISWFRVKNSQKDIRYIKNLLHHIVFYVSMVL